MKLGKLGDPDHILLGEKVGLPCNGGLFGSAHALNVGNDLQRCISRLKSLLLRFRLFTLLENWTLDNFLEGGGVQQVLNLKNVFEIRVRFVMGGVPLPGSRPVLS